MNRRDLERELHAIGRSPTPGPAPELVEGLAARLSDIGAPEPRRPSRTGIPRLAMATALLVAVVGAVLLTTSQTPPALTLTSSIDTTVELPDGGILSDPAGLEVPDGSVIRTGSLGRLEADGFVLGPNREARVRNGRLTDERPYRRPVPTEGTRPQATRPPSETPAAPARSPSPTRDAAFAPIDLMCRGTERTVVCRWSPIAHGEFANYALVRNDQEFTQEIFRTNDPAETTFTDTQVRRGAVYSYEVRALTADGRLLASGGPVRAGAG